VLQVIVDEILAKRSDLSANQIRELIEEKKKEGRGLLSDEGAARLVAEELLIQTRGTELGRMHVKNLVSGLNDVTLSGRVLLAWPPQQFQRRDGTSGRVMRIILVDRSGKARCALWDRHVDIAEKAGNLQGRILRIGHAYTRQGLTGEAEVHAGDRSSVEIDPSGLQMSEFPEFKELFTRIGDLGQQDNSINVLGIIQTDPRTYKFERDERPGSALRTSLADESGTVPIVVWNERAEELAELKIGDILQIINCRTRIDNNGKLEVHVESRSQVTKLDSPPDYLKPPISRSYEIGTISSQTASIDISVFILAKGKTQEIKRTTGETMKLSTLLVGDGTGVIQLSLWDDKATNFNQFNEGDFLQLRNATVTEWSGNLRLNLGKSGEIETIEKKATMSTPPITTLNSLQSAKALLIVEGLIADSPTIRQVTTERESNVNVASFTLKDDTGSVRVTLWREHAGYASNLHAGQRVKLTGIRAHAGLGGQPELSSIQLTKIETIGPYSEGLTK
jgi:replication factor A1